MRYDPRLTRQPTYYYQQDHEGSVTYLLNTSGNVIESYKYDALARRPSTNADGQCDLLLRLQQPVPVTGGNTRTLFGSSTNTGRAPIIPAWADS